MSKNTSNLLNLRNRRNRLDRKSFERGTLAANYHLCPHCGQRLTYRKADYLIREEQPKSTITPPE
ncbi:MAG: hypothetical protein AUI83_07425 [Armatimonadetes bacterium 13_1_40CM_3_65_7]|nr:MAG: hypothetical protein AUI83_07425 [Armatimonadetes bacterium 13_1_40CM_3_65_7]